MSTHTIIRAGRLRLKMSERQFADAVGVSRGAVQQWEKEDGTAPKRAHQKKVADILGISIAELMRQDEVAPQYERVVHIAAEKSAPYSSSLATVIQQLAAHLSAMDEDTRHIAAGLLRDLAKNPSAQDKVSAALVALASVANVKAA